MSALPVLPVHEGTVLGDPVIPHDNGTLLPLDSGLEIGTIGEVVIQELENGI
jgi:hypothetical protein